MNPQFQNWRRAILTAVVAAMVIGCAEGPFWRMGQYSPWVQKKWAAEEELADTLFSKRRRMTEIVERAKNGSVEDKDRAAQELFHQFFNDSILLTRLQAVRLMSELDCPTTYQSLRAASLDPNVDMRLAAAQAWRHMPDDQAVPMLVQMLQHDKNVDVRLAATRALGDFTGGVTVAALQSALSDADPAIQLRATESLARSTGETLGRDVAAWKRFLGEDRVATQSAPDNGTLRR
ncbi:MAG TPA: HEAT repeat domain-containing protein [Pirellulaceae bacterium]|nr:HEAT repeat domain-containing protein [Pirellulaceae bacterium]